MNVKNLLIMAVTTAMSFGFAACSSDDDDDTSGLLYNDVNSEYNDYVSVCGREVISNIWVKSGRLPTISGNILIMSMEIPGHLSLKVLHKWIISIGVYAE